MRSNPATQQITPAASTIGAKSIRPVCAIHAPTGAIARGDTEKEVRCAGESFCERVEKNERQRNRRENQRSID